MHDVEKVPDDLLDFVHLTREVQGDANTGKVSDVVTDL